MRLYYGTVFDFDSDVGVGCEIEFAVVLFKCVVVFVCVLICCFLCLCDVFEFGRCCVLLFLVFGCWFLCLVLSLVLLFVWCTTFMLLFDDLCIC